MKQIKSYMKMPVVKVVMVVALICVAFFIRKILLEADTQKEETSGMRNANYAPEVSKDHKGRKAFERAFKDAEILMACEEDVDDNGRRDLVVVYKEGKHIRMVVAIQSESEDVYSYSIPVPAPVENQKIQFQNIDEEGPIEFIVSGEKKGAVGYAIYRMIDGEPVDLFGDGMEDCC